MTRRNYNCRQTELYTIAEVVWHSVSQHLADFNNFRPRYTAAYIAARLAELETAKALPYKAVRKSKVASMRKKLKEANSICLQDFQSLKCYIRGAYTPDFHTIEFKAAGQSHFRKATGCNWDSTQALLNNASNFLAAKEAILLAGDNMPDTFPLKLETNFKQFSALHMQFLAEEEAAVNGTEEKIKQNNKVFDQLKTVFRDGQLIFRHHHSVRKQFTFTDLLYLVSGAHKASAHNQIEEQP